MTSKAEIRRANRARKRTQRLAKVASRPVPDILKGNRRRALLAAISLTFVFIFVSICVVDCLLRDPSELHPERREYTFRLFTICSNMVSAVACFLSIPFAVEGVRKNTYDIPEWCVTIHYMGAVSVSITFIFAVFLILPVKGLYLAFGGPNLFMHLICPVLCICAFMFLQSEHLMTWKHSCLSLIPFVIYATVYFIEVVALGVEGGGWRDIYQLNTMVPVAVSLPIMVGLALGLSRALGLMHNLISTRQAVMDQRIAIAFADKVPEDSLDGQVAKLARRHAKGESFGEYIVIPKMLLEDLNGKFGNEHTMDNLCRMYLDYYLAEKAEGNPESQIPEALVPEVAEEPKDKPSVGA